MVVEIRLLCWPKPIESTVKTGPAEAALDTINPPSRAAASKVPFRNSVILFPAVPINYSLTKCLPPVSGKLSKHCARSDHKKIAGISWWNFLLTN
jgi:hypothetical protein